MHVRLYRRPREHILAGALSKGARLPSARVLARDLGISRNTVEAAYARLVDEGFVMRRTGVGSAVVESLGEVAPFSGSRIRSDRPPARASQPAPPSPSPATLGKRGALMPALGQAESESDTGTGAWATNAPGFPWQRWNRLLSREARRTGAALLSASPPEGLQVLRVQIAHHASLARGVRCEPDQVLVVNSTQQAIDTAARLLLDPGKPAFIEDPCYPSALAALKAAGASVRGLPVDDAGAVTDRLPGNARPGLVYVTPSHQFPLGMTMTLARRLSLLNWASKTGSYVLEDDYDSEFRHDGRPITALQGLDARGRVLYIGTFNKILFPGLRLAYLIVPSGLARAFASARRIIDGYSPPLPQAVLAEFMASGHFASYLRQARHHFRACRDAVVKAVGRHWGNAVHLGPASTGLHVVVRLPRGADDVRLARHPVRGISIAPLSRYYSRRRREAGLLIGYGTATVEEIETEIRRLASIVRS